MISPVRTRFADLDDAAATSARLVPAGGTSGQVLAKASGTDYATHWVDAATGGGGGTPGGSSGQVQFNDGGAFAGDSALTYNGTTDTLTLAGTLVTASASTYQAKFGSTLPFYVMANNPTLGFNAYYSGGWLYGTTGYGGIVDFGASGDGSYTLYTTAASGTGGAALTLVSRFKVYPTGSVFFGSNPSDLGSAVAIQPNSPSAVGAIVRGAASQSANLQEWQDSTGTVVAAITPAGVFSGTIGQSQVTGLTSALAAKAPLASPALTGIPTAPTAAVGTNTTQIATTAFVLANAGGGGGSIASTSSVLKGDGAGAAVAATAGTDYVAPGGVSGGQTIKGDTASGGNLTLQSTAHATKGKVLLNSTTTVVDASGKVGIGTATPSVELEVVGDVKLNSSLAFTGGTCTILMGGGTCALSVDGSHVFNFSGPSTIWNSYLGSTTFLGGSDQPAVIFQGKSGQTGPLQALQQLSSTATARNAGYIDAVLATATDASWKGRATVSAGDYTSSNAGRREGVRVESDGTQPLLSFYGKTPAVAKAATPTTLADVIALLQALGLCS